MPCPQPTVTLTPHPLPRRPFPACPAAARSSTPSSPTPSSSVCGLTGTPCFRARSRGPSTTRSAPRKALRCSRRLEGAGRLAQQSGEGGWGLCAPTGRLLRRARRTAEDRLRGRQRAKGSRALLRGTACVGCSLRFGCSYLVLRCPAPYCQSCADLDSCSACLLLSTCVVLTSVRLQHVTLVSASGEVSGVGSIEHGQLGVPLTVGFLSTCLQERVDAGMASIAQVRTSVHAGRENVPRSAGVVTQYRSQERLARVLVCARFAQRFVPVVADEARNAACAREWAPFPRDDSS